MNEAELVAVVMILRLLVDRTVLSGLVMLMLYVERELTLSPVLSMARTNHECGPYESGALGVYDVPEILF